MSSVVFRPLLHDPLGWKPSRSTYTEHYKWRTHRPSISSKKTSPYSQKNQRKIRRIDPVLRDWPAAQTTEEQTIQPVVFVENHQPRRERTVMFRPSSVIEPRPRSASVVVERLPFALQASIPESSVPVDANNDKSRHWLSYPKADTPPHIVEIKRRLGQLKISSTLGRPPPAVQPEDQPEPVTRPATAVPETQQVDDSSPMLHVEKRTTPDDLRAARHRLDKHRYHSALDNYPPRPQTSFVRRSDVDEQPEDEPSSSVIIQTIDCDSLPPEYANALETANAAFDEYEKQRLKNVPRRVDSAPVDRYRQHSGLWIRDATDKERASAMKILKGVLPQSILGYGNPTRPRAARASSAPRGLGQTRTQHQFPCEVCEKLLIKRHLWDLNRSDAFTCNHRAPI